MTSKPVLTFSATLHSFVDDFCETFEPSLVFEDAEDAEYSWLVVNRSSGTELPAVSEAALAEGKRVARSAAGQQLVDRLHAVASGHG